MTTIELEPIEPRDALELYLQECEGELSPNSITAKQYQLGFFVRWCEGANESGDVPDDAEPRITNLNEISGRDFLQFKSWRKGEINKVTLRTNLSSLRQFMRFCVNIEAVPGSIPEKIGVPVLEHGENERETFMEKEEAKTILEYLETYRFASLDHALFKLTWETGLRLSGLHSLDVDDVDFEKNQIDVQHHPDEGSRLKNGPDGERIVTLPESTIELVRQYCEHHRHKEEDDYGRKPLFSTAQGRMHKRYLPKHIYRITCPCEHGQACPDGREPTECEHTGSYDSAVGCPYNTRPHDIRRGSITNWLKREVPEKVISDRMNVSLETLDRHYDARTPQERADQRRQYVDDV